jgi:DNA-binding MarR family transcriptional regulator
MTADPDVDDVARTLIVSVGLLRRRLRQVPVEGDLTLPESAALARLDRGGPATASALARREQISPQSMGATLAALEARGLVERRPDPDDGRRVVLSVTAAGLQTLRDRRSTRTQALAQALTAGFSRPELAQLMAAAPLLERLAQSI